MKTIAPLAVAGIILLELSGGVPDSSVGGPLTLAFACLLAALAYGLYEAWSMKRGVLGWIVSIATAIAGALVGAMLGGTVSDMVMGPLASYLQLDGSLASTRHPMLYVFSGAMMLLTLLGAWLALWLVNRLR